MDLLVTGVVASVLGTLMMDSLNHLFARIGIVGSLPDSGHKISTNFNLA
jgi:hypothetical protein